MMRRDLLIIFFVPLAVFINFFVASGREASDDQKYHCNNTTSPSPCRNLLNISFPFRLNSDPPDCGGDPRYELSCENNRTVLYLYSGKYYVEAIWYEKRMMRLVDSGIHIHNCSSLPLHPLTHLCYFSIYGRDPYYHPTSPRKESYVTFLSCERPILIKAKSPDSSFAINTSPCINDLSYSDVPDLCTIGTMFPIHRLEYEAGHHPSFSEIHHQLAMGFELSRFRIDCKSCYPLGGSCYPELDPFNNYSLQCGDPCINDRAIFRFYFAMKASVHGYTNIEEFLQEHNNLMLLQYSYSEIKKKTKHFSDKLGQRGFGSVYKGKLRSGNFVAIKMLVKFIGNGQDFTIGRIHHVNVVRLIGFCFEGSKRALVYDFMLNGSLDKFIFTPKQTEIYLRIAHGIEYLHRGCAMRILHFDIKPHNVLLDEDLTPKISDFGLVKLYLTTENTVSLTATWGTIGYIAPELVYKSIGSVSYKTDVYSFGMLLMEMAGRRKNVNPFANTSNMEMEDASEEDKSIVRKMIIVALSCIQLKPDDHPSMNRVIEMLESPTELLPMPPRPFLGSSFERMKEDQTIVEPSTTSLHSSSSSNYSAIRSN
ncbi:hypothetical protein NE237_027931 [Protea cynaroides]|uniref:Protein kinase domain-containing protein n=1 Tax=Protea cynaroides TaxID=273540 RepID=A0A9Q0GSU3_9MAGN|nr:hypothetical protein NE237_027931 [Protea cynaroides]